jgi:hypothetical protein
MVIKITEKVGPRDGSVGSDEEFAGSSKTNEACSSKCKRGLLPASEFEPLT